MFRTDANARIDSGRVRRCQEERNERETTQSGTRPALGDWCNQLGAEGQRGLGQECQLHWLQDLHLGAMDTGQESVDGSAHRRWDQSATCLERLAESGWYRC